MAWHDGGVTDEELFEDLSRRLREAHRRVGALDVPQGQKARVVTRLLAVSDAAKHDLVRASARLERLLADLDDGRFPTPEG